LNAFFLCLSEILNGNNNSSFDHKKLMPRDNAVNSRQLFPSSFLQRLRKMDKKNITQIVVAKRGKTHPIIAFI